MLSDKIMPLPKLRISDFSEKLEAEYPIGKYKSGESKTCYICNKKFDVGDFFVNSSKPIIDREILKERIEKEFGKEIADERISEMVKIKSALVHTRCEPRTDKIVNLIYSPYYSCICSY